MILGLITGYASAGHISMTFRGLDANYTFTPFAMQILRESVACRIGFNQTVVFLDSITIRNRTFEFGSDDEINKPNNLPYNCYFINMGHWSSNPSKINRNLLKELKDELEVTFKLSFPGSSKKAYGINIIPFLSTSINEYYSDILVNDYMAFYVGSIPELIHQQHTIGLFKDSDHWILLYMFMAQFALIVIGNIILNKLKKRIPNPRFAGLSKQDPIYVIIK